MIGINVYKLTMVYIMVVLVRMKQWFFKTMHKVVSLKGRSYSLATHHFWIGPDYNHHWYTYL